MAGSLCYATDQPISDRLVPSSPVDRNVRPAQAKSLAVPVRIVQVAASHPLDVESGATKGLSLASASPTAAEIEALIAESHPDIRVLVDYWRGKKGERRMPRRSDIDPAELKPYLPRISLIDVVPDERRFVYRLVGTEEVALRGYDPTGKSVGEGFFGPNRELAFEHYGYVVEHKAPYCYRGDFDVQDGVVENEDVIFLPLSEDGENVNMILLFYFDYRDHRRVDPSSVLARTQPRKSDDPA
jgi:hypothetical protein